MIAFKAYTKIKNLEILQKTDDGVTLCLTLKSSITFVPFDGAYFCLCFHDIGSILLMWL